MDSNIDMEDILKDLGCSDGFRIPVANEENRALEMEIQKKQKEKDNLKSALEDVNERLTGMKKHLVNVQHEMKQNQNLIIVQQNQINNEESLLKASRMEEETIQSDIKRIKRNWDELNSRQKSLQSDIERVNAKVEKLKSAAKWDEDALLAWDEEVSRGNDDMIMLEKFTKEDEIRFNELELRRQNLRMELENKRHKVTSAKNDILSMEQSLEKTAQLFRKQHIDRKALVQQWESSVRILHQRDEDINRAIEEIGNLKALAKGRLKDLEEQRSFYLTQEENNRELERDISAFGKEASEKKERLKVLETLVHDLGGNLVTIQNILDKLYSEINKMRSRKKQLLKDIKTKIMQTEEAKTKLNQGVEELEKVKNKNLSASDRVKCLEEIYRDEEKIIEKIAFENKKLNDLMFQVTEQLRDLRAGEKTQKSTLENTESNIFQIKKHLAKAEQELSRQKELIYNMDFQYMEKDIVLNKMLGLAKEDKDTEKFEKRISELEEQQAQLTSKNSLLSKEVSRLEEEMRRLTVDMQNDAKELEILKNKRQDNILLTECGTKQLKAMRMRNQNKQVDENVLKLRVNQAEKALEKVGGKVFSLEKARLELEQAMKEREIELEALKDIMNVRRRVLHEQSAGLNSRINLGKIKVDHLKKKYEVTVGKMGTDEDGQPLSVTYIKIKSAQEKFDLQEIGDKLDAKIKRSEQEITALENTLKVINASNKAYRNNLQSLDANSDEIAEKEQLERCLVQELDEMRKKKKELEDLNDETKRLEEIYNELDRKEEEMLNSWKEKQEQIAQTERELKEQEDKLLRAEKQMKKSIKEIRGTLIPKFQTIEEKDIELRELMEQNQSALQQYTEFVTRTIEPGPVVARYMAEKGIEMPLAKSPSDLIKYASMASLASPCAGDSASSRSTVTQSARSSSSCLVSPSIVTLDSSQLDSDQRKSQPCGSLTGNKNSVRFHVGGTKK